MNYSTLVVCGKCGVKEGIAVQDGIISYELCKRCKHEGVGGSEGKLFGAPNRKPEESKKKENIITDYKI